MHHHLRQWDNGNLSWIVTKQIAYPIADGAIKVKQERLYKREAIDRVEQQQRFRDCKTQRPIFLLLHHTGEFFYRRSRVQHLQLLNRFELDLRGYAIHLGQSHVDFKAGWHNVRMTHTNASIATHFGELVDPRQDRGKNHVLMEIIIMAVVAVIGGANDWVHVELFCRAKEAWLRSELKLTLPQGVPSHDTFGRVFSLLAPETFQRCFVHWVRAMAELKLGEVVSLDGKALRRSHDRLHGKAAVMMVNAWASEAGLALGPRDVPEDTNEISVVPELLQQLVLTGCIVTMDAGPLPDREYADRG